ncbi:MAG TPA: type II toxin-antitoxin system RelE/ParE family toxin [Acetobacteraceae bacterium]|nr:type II toxin-antitoxin system RelE/ParE family toxin [Acetobacteraceae bacterium]
MDQGRAKRLRGLPGGRPPEVRTRSHGRGRGPHAGHCQAAARARVRCDGTGAEASRDAFRVVYARQIGEAIWVVHAFQKKSTSGIATPKHEIDLMRERLKRLKEALK